AAPPPPPAPLSPYTPLFRSGRRHRDGAFAGPDRRPAESSFAPTRLCAASRLHWGKLAPRNRGRGNDSMYSIIVVPPPGGAGTGQDRKSTRLNSSHVKISYAV